MQWDFSVAGASPESTAHIGDTARMGAKVKFEAHDIFV